MRVNVLLPDDLLERLRRKAAAEGRALASLIEDGLRVILSDSAKSAGRRRVQPRISGADGGLFPGIDVANPRSLQETEDLEYLRRAQRSE